MAVIEEVDEKAPQVGPSADEKGTSGGVESSKANDVIDFSDMLPGGFKAFNNPNFPPRMTLDEKLKSLDNVPLFMRDLPSDEEVRAGGVVEDAASKDALEALKSLAFDGTPDEIAENFKAQGNDYFKGKRYREAVSFYSQAIDVSPPDTKLLESCYLNRAACNLALKNYGQTLRDTSQALALNPTSEKAFYRAARALLATDKVAEALDCCDHALRANPENKDVKELREKVTKRKNEVERIQAERKERERRKLETDKALNQAFLARGLWIETSSRPPDNPARPHFDPDSLSSSSSPSIPLSGPLASSWKAPDAIRTQLIFPVFLLYPQYAQSDLIPEYPEDTPIGLYLDEMFPGPAGSSTQPTARQPWDERGEYVSAKLQVYATTRQKRLLKIGRKLSLREIIDQGAKDPEKGADRDGVMLKDGLVSLIVLPKGSDAEKTWIAKFKQERGGGR